jgi:hypothetical protein
VRCKAHKREQALPTKPLHDDNTVDAPFQETWKVPKILNRVYLRDRKPPQNGYSTESGPFLVLLVTDSEYSQSAGAKPILSPSCTYLISPGARCCCCGSCGFLLLLLRAPTPPRPSPFFGEREVQKKIACSVGCGGWTCWRLRGRGQGVGQVVVYVCCIRGW